MLDMAGQIMRIGKLHDKSNMSGPPAFPFVGKHVCIHKLQAFQPPSRAPNPQASQTPRLSLEPSSLQASWPARPSTPRCLHIQTAIQICSLSLDE